MTIDISALRSIAQAAKALRSRSLPFATESLAANFVL